MSLLNVMIVVLILILLITVREQSPYNPVSKDRRRANPDYKEPTTGISCETAGYVFNDTLQACIFSNCEKVPDGRKIHDPLTMDDDTYCICFNRKPIWKKCGANQKFSSSINSCVDLTPCFGSQLESGMFKIWDDSYWRCKGDIGVMEKCPDHSTFDGKKCTSALCTVPDGINPIKGVRSNYTNQAVLCKGGIIDRFMNCQFPLDKDVPEYLRSSFYSSVLIPQIVHTWNGCEYQSLDQVWSGVVCLHVDSRVGYDPYELPNYYFEKGVVRYDPNSHCLENRLLTSHDDFCQETGILRFRLSGGRYYDCGTKQVTNCPTGQIFANGACVKENECMSGDHKFQNWFFFTDSGNLCAGNKVAIEVPRQTDTFYKEIGIYATQRDTHHPTEKVSSTKYRIGNRTLECNPGYVVHDWTFRCVKAECSNAMFLMDSRFNNLESVAYSVFGKKIFGCDRSGEIVEVKETGCSHDLNPFTGKCEPDRTADYCTELQNATHITHPLTGAVFDCVRNTHVRGLHATSVAFLTNGNKLFDGQNWIVRSSSSSSTTAVSLSRKYPGKEGR